MNDDIPARGLAPDGIPTDTPSPAKRASARRKAEDHFAAAERRDSEVRKELEAQRAATLAQMTKLRALRLAKEADELAAAALAPKPVRAARPRRIKV